MNAVDAPTGESPGGRLVRSSSIVIALTALAAGLAGSTQPTGTVGVDMFWRAVAAAGFGFGLRSVAPNIRRLALVALAPVVSLPVGAVALVASLLVAGAGHVSGSRTARQNAALGMFPVLALFSLTDRFVTGSAALAAAASLAVVALGSLRELAPTSRRQLARLLSIPVLAGLAVGALYVVQMAGHAPSLAKVAQQVADDPGEIDRPAFAARLGRARVTADHWYFRPLEAIPVGAQNVRAARNLLSAADDIVGAAETQSPEASGGSLPDDPSDLGSIAADVCSGVETLADQVSDPGAGLLVPPLRKAIDKMDDYRDLIESGAALCPVAPHLSSLAGYDGDRSHLVLFATTAESRGTVGLITNWARISASEGSFSLEDSGRSVPLNDLLAEREATVTLPPGSDGLWGRFDPARHFQDVSLSPSAPVVADAAADLFTQAYPDHPPDGVVIIGPQAIAAVVGLCSGIDAGDVELDASNTVDFLTRGQYEIDLSYGRRVQLLQTILDTLFGKISDGECGASPDGLTGVLDAIVDGEVLYVPRDGAMRPDVVSTPLGGDLPTRDEGVLFGVVEQNAGLDKLDAYLVRDTELAWPDRSSATPQLRLTYRNDAPEILPDYVLGLDHGSAPERVNRRRVSIYAPAVATAVSWVAGGKAEATEIEMYRGREGGHWVSTFMIDVQPDVPAEILVEFEGWKAPSDSLTVLRPTALQHGEMTIVMKDRVQSVPIAGRISEVSVS